MAVSKLSQIALATAIPALSSLFVSADTPVDLLYTCSQLAIAIGASQPANGNLQFYYSATGSNSNDGLTPSTAFADPQFAVDYAALFNYQGLYSVTVTDASGGSYNFAGVGIAMPALNNCPSATFVGAGVSSTTIEMGQAGFRGGGSWTFQDFTADVNDSVAFGNAGTGVVWILFDNVTVTDSTNSGANTILSPSFGAEILVNSGCTFTLDPFAIFAAPMLGEAAVISFFADIVLPGSSFGSAGAWVSDQGLGTGSFFWQGNTVTNAGSFAGAQAQIEGNGFFNWRTDTGQLSDVPGVATNNIVSNTVVLYSLGTNIFGDAVVPVSGQPTTSDMLPGTYLVVKDTTQPTGFGNYSAYYDGTIIVFDGPIGKFLVSALPTGLPANTEAWASDLSSPVFGNAAVGGGSIFGPVYFDGTIWRCG